MNLPLPSMMPAANVLILDDSPADCAVLERYLEADPMRVYRLHICRALEEALEMCAKIRPDCVLVDYALGDGTGLDFLRHLPREPDGHYSYPVIMLTGTGNEEVVVEAFKNGARDYLIKDLLTPDSLQRAVGAALYKAETERTLRDHRSEVDRLYQEAKDAHARKDQFLAALSHELRTPLTPILAAVSSCRPESLSPKELEEIFDLIRRNVELEARLIDDLLDLTRISQGKLQLRPAPVDVHEILENALETCREEAASKQLTISSSLAAAPSVVSGDPARLQQVFWNLLKNAVKFTPAGGSIHVETRNPAPGAVEIAVSDTGIGIHSEALPKIFDAFEQGGPDVTKRFGGLGLGLAISRALTEAHEGVLAATSEGVGKGARFTVTLRVARDQVSAGTPGRDGAQGADGVAPTFSKCSVLLVEDHTDSANLLARSMERSGLEVILARSVAEAVGAFQAHHVHLIVSDIGLPDGTGMDVMEQVQKIRSVPGIALSGYGMEEDLVRSRAAGFSEHLTKPIDWPSLRAAVSRLLNKAAE